MQGLKIVDTGHFAPEGVMTNDDWAQVIDTSDEWIYARTGMKKRHFVQEGESSTMVAGEAAKRAIEKAGIPKDEIGALVVATFSPDYLVPATACLVQAYAELPDEMLCFDLNASCSGFVFGIETVRGLLLQSEKKYAVLVGCETISRKLDFTDRGTCILFGDGAGALVLTLDDKEYKSKFGCHGDDKMIFCGTGDPVEEFVHMDGQETYQFAVKAVPGLITDTIAKAGWRVDDIDWFICHQANARILKAVSRKLKAPAEKFYTNIEEYGNTVAASIPLVIDEMNNKGLLKRGQKIVISGFGAGRTWGAVAMEY